MNYLESRGSRHAIVAGLACLLTLMIFLMAGEMSQRHWAWIQSLSREQKQLLSVLSLLSVTVSAAVYVYRTRSKRESQET
jgi:hypothetical protein